MLGGASLSKEAKSQIKIVQKKKNFDYYDEELMNSIIMNKELSTNRPKNSLFGENVSLYSKRTQKYKSKGVLKANLILEDAPDTTRAKENN